MYALLFALVLFMSVIGLAALVILEKTPWPWHLTLAVLAGFGFGGGLLWAVIALGVSVAAGETLGQRLLMLMPLAIPTAVALGTAWIARRRPAS